MFARDRHDKIILDYSSSTHWEAPLDQLLFMRVGDSQSGTGKSARSKPLTSFLNDFSQ